MDAQEERRLIDRVRTYLHERTSDAAASESTLAAAEYIDAPNFTKEMRALRALPLIVAHGSEIVRSGDFVTLELGGAPLLATRDSAGKARVFYNVCRHRGAKLVGESTGSKTSFVCPYHAWAYACDGRLLGASDAQAFPQAMQERPGLIEVSSHEHLGFVWVSLDGNAEDVVPSLAPLHDELHALFSLYPRAYRPHTRASAGNWKIFVDGGLETYHFRVAHKDTISPFFFDDFLLRDDFGPHQRLVLPRRSFDEKTTKLREHANLVYLLFPNTQILAQADHLVVIRARPIDVAHTLVDVLMLVPNGGDDTYWEKNRRITLNVLEEDFALGERVHAGLASGAVSETRIGRNEVGLAEFHAQLRALL